MPKVNFADVEDSQDFSPLPDGEYPCILSGLEEVQTKAGDEMWRLTFKVEKGEYAGRKIWDNMVWSTAAMKRVKLICSRLGLDVSGELDVQPVNILDAQVYITVEQGEYEANDGTVKKKNVVPFAGYRAIESSTGGEQKKEDGEDDLPF